MAIGHVRQVLGPVVVIGFENETPEIGDYVEIRTGDREGTVVGGEVMQDLGGTSSRAHVRRDRRSVTRT